MTLPQPGHEGMQETQVTHDRDPFILSVPATAPATSPLSAGPWLPGLPSRLPSLEDQTQAAKADNAGQGVLCSPHHPPRAKRVIWLTMAGGPSHLETFDYKPKLAEMHGKPMPGVPHQGTAARSCRGRS